MATEAPKVKEDQGYFLTDSLGNHFVFYLRQIPIVILIQGDPPME